MTFDCDGNDATATAMLDQMNMIDGQIIHTTSNYDASFTANHNWTLLQITIHTLCPLPCFQHKSSTHWTKSWSKIVYLHTASRRHAAIYNHLNRGAISLTKPLQALVFQYYNALPCKMVILCQWGLLGTLFSSTLFLCKSFAKFKCSRKFRAGPELSETFYGIKIG